MMDIAVVGCLNCHASLGKWAYAAGPTAAARTRRPSDDLMTACGASDDTDH